MRLALERRAERSILIAFASPLLAVALTLATGALLFWLLGKPPVQALKIYFLDPLTDTWALQEIAVKATPLVLIAVGLSLCYLANAWNIGAEGQFLVGAIVGGWLAVKTHGTDAGYWVLPAMLLLGALGGALYAAIPALFKVRFGASEILTSLMLVYVAELLLDYLVRGPWRDPKGFNFPTTAEFDAVASMPTFMEGSRLHLGAIIALLVVIWATVMLGRTLRGFEIKLVGAAPRAARFAGFSDKTLTVVTFLISGALAGLAGIIEVSATVEPPAAQHLARLRLHGDHRGVPRPPASGRDSDRRAVPCAHLHRRRERADRAESAARSHQGVPGHPAVLRARLRHADPLPLPSDLRSEGGAWSSLKPSC